MGIIFLVIGLFVALAGLSIWCFERVDLLSNVDQTTIVDQKALARWAGQCLIALGALAFGVSGFMWDSTTERNQLLACIAFILASQLLVVVYLNGLQQYTK